MKKFLLLKFIFIILFIQGQQEDITLDQLLINSGNYNKASLDSRALYQRSIMYADIPHYGGSGSIQYFKIRTRRVLSFIS